MSRPSDKVRKLREAVKAEALAKWEHNLEVDALLYTYTTYTKEQFITAVKAMIAKIEGIDVSLPKKEYLTQCRTGNTDDIYYPEDMYSPEDM